MGPRASAHRCRPGVPICRSAVWGVALLAAATARADLAADADAVLRDPAVARATVGVQVVRLGPTPGDPAVVPRVVYRRNAGLPLTPASNLKLLTTSAALDHFGPAFAFRTRLVAHGSDLVLVGDGDPAFGDAELLTPQRPGRDHGLSRVDRPSPRRRYHPGPRRGRRRHRVRRRRAVPPALAGRPAAETGTRPRCRA